MAPVLSTLLHEGLTKNIQCELLACIGGVTFGTKVIGQMIMET